MRLWACAIIAAVMWMTGVGWAAPSVKELVKAEMLADTSGLVGGKVFNVGVLLKIEPGWHVYWKNPGDSGMATKVTIEAPAGWTVGEVLYPVPMKHEDSAGVTYGYEDEVMLIARVTPGAEVTGDSVTLKARVKFLVCEKVCLPGSEDVAVTLPVGKDVSAANEAEFAKWVARVPGSAKSKPVVKWIRSGAAKSPVWVGLIQLEMGERVSGVEWFPGRNEKVEINEIRAGAASGMISVEFRAVVREGQVSPGVLESVVAYTLADGSRHGVNVAVPFEAFEK